MYKEITECRICGNRDLIPVLDLGSQYLTGVFPRSTEGPLTSGPLHLVKCAEKGDGKTCGLLQLGHSYDHSELYGNNYGYRSGLNRSMVIHLHEKVRKIEEMAGLKAGDLIIDIGSNDSTLLQGYPEKGLHLLGIDPTGAKFRQYYPDTIDLVPDFFSAKAIEARHGKKKAKVITSIAMFYDLESPMDFMNQIGEVLADDGLWVFEQSYMPTMLAMNAYDTVCHEHLEYYAMRQIEWLCKRTGFKIVDVDTNSVNGGSFSVTATKKEAPYREQSDLVHNLVTRERQAGLEGLKPFLEFKERVYHHRDELVALVDKLNTQGKRIFGYGASTKGNVVLQYCGFSRKDIPCIAEVNEDKFGSYTPGTYIPIIAEAEARAMKPDYFMVLPWHFRDNLVAREKEFLSSGGKMLFPLPFVEVVSE